MTSEIIGLGNNYILPTWFKIGIFHLLYRHEKVKNIKILFVIVAQ